MNEEKFTAIRYGQNNESEAFADLIALEALANRKPSEVHDVYWIVAPRLTGDYPAATENSGKWLLFVPVEQIDTVWAEIKQATEEGRLGNKSKVATSKPNANAASLDTKVICVYTYDWTDEEDVRLIRQELRLLGFSNKIPYKADADTRIGRYSNGGEKRISKYYE